jgi:hypothetical protein
LNIETGKTSIFVSYFNIKAKMRDITDIQINSGKTYQIAHSLPDVTPDINQIK